MEGGTAAQAATTPGWPLRLAHTAQTGLVGALLFILNSRLKTTGAMGKEAEGWSWRRMVMDVAQGPNLNPNPNLDQDPKCPSPLQAPDQDLASWLIAKAFSILLLQL